jgi:hypothetical protein
MSDQNSWVAPASISALAALSALGFGIYRYVQKQRLLRPALVLLGGAPGEGDDGNVGYELTIKNIGKRTASEIKFRTRAAAESDPSAVATIHEWSTALDYTPGSEMKLMIWPPAPFAATTLMQVAVEYKDPTNSRVYSEDYWLVIVAGLAGAVTGMNAGQRDSARTLWGRFV